MKKQFRELVAVDVETSGPSPFRNQILSVALAPFDSSLPSFQVFVDHEEIEWSDAASSIFEQYQRDWYAKRVPPRTAVNELVVYLSNLPLDEVRLVGHNVGFDYSFLRQLVFLAGVERLPKISHRSIDTHSVLYALYLVDRVDGEALSSDGAFRRFRVRSRTRPGTQPLVTLSP